MFGDGFQIELTRPEWLLGLLIVPILIAYFYRSLVDFPRRQMLFSLAVRTVIATLLVLSLAGLNALKSTQEMFVIFALDDSLSVDSDSREKALEYIQKAVDSTENKTAFRVLPFATTPGEFVSTLPEKPLESVAAANEDPADESTDAGSTVADPTADPNADPNAPSGDKDTADDETAVVGTGKTDDTEKSADEKEREKKWREGSNLQSAIEIASAGMPPDYVPRVVILSDGNETLGDARKAALSAGLRISTVPLSTRDDPEMQVSAVNVPAQVAQGEPFNVKVLVDSNHDDEALIEIYNGEHKIVSAQKPIKKGENEFVFTQQVDRPSEFSARISRVRKSDGTAADTSFKDTLLDNNMASGLVYAAGKPRVLLIEAVPELAQSLEWALDEEGIKVDVRPPQGMPDSLADLQNYEVLMLSNVPATDLSARQMEVIRTYVSELGGGFIMLGGDQSFGLGGYYKSVVEEVLPVRSDFEKEKEKPSLAMCLIIDKSGSMGGQKIELAKDAARGAVELLGQKDQIGVIAFDGSPYWISEIRPLSQKSLVADRIAGIQAGGGTTLYPAMEEAFDALQSTAAKLKHVIILTDGYSTPGDFEGITQSMAAARITVSTVGVGDADQNLLETIAENGNGRYYFTDDPSSVPQIFAKETMTASKSAINEEPFIPQSIRATQVLSDIDFEEAPFLLGYVITRPKPTSEVILVAESGDPLLVWWRYGLGMSVAFTSDAKSRWAAEWLTWPGFNKFWAQTVRHCMRKSATRGFVVDLKRMGNTAKIKIDSVDPSGRFLNKADTQLTLIDPRLRDSKIQIEQTAPGRYEAQFDVPDTGAWHLQMTQKQNKKTIYQQSRGLMVGYPDELRLRPPNEDLLKSIARASGGEFDPKPETIFAEKEDDKAQRATPLWPWLLTIAMVLFLIDVALRRIDFSLIFGRTRHRQKLRA